MASNKRFLFIIFVVNVYTVSCQNGGQPDFIIPIPEVTVTIGGSVSSIPVQYEELIVPIVFEPVQNVEPNFQLNPSYQSYAPQTPPVIIIDDGNKNDMTWLYLLLLLGKFNNGGNGGNGCYDNCNYNGGGYYDNNYYSPRTVY